MKRKEERLYEEKLDHEERLLDAFGYRTSEDFDGECNKCRYRDAFLHGGVRSVCKRFTHMFYDHDVWVYNAAHCDFYTWLPGRDL